MKRLNQINFAAVVVFGLAWLGLTSVHRRAATITVTSTADSGAGTLRAALASAANGDTIGFSLTTPVKITLTSGELLVTKSVTIFGLGANALAVDGNAASRVFHIAPGVAVSIVNLTITNGYASGPRYPDTLGGGIFNDRATLTVSKCALTGNSASLGGGIANDGTLTMSNCTLSNTRLRRPHS